jgi:hypothetical protein
MNSARKTVIVALVIISCMVGAAYKFGQLERRVQAQGEIIAGFEARTQDVLQNWDEMRRTQLVLIKLYEGGNGSD